MPIFFWDKKTGRYRDSNTKRFVSRSVVLKMVEIQNKRSKTYLEKQAKRLVNREISLSQFQTIMTEELKRSHLRMGLLASGGKDGISKAGYGATGQRLKEEYSYLRNFVNAIARGELSEKRIIYRAGLYANSSAAAFYKSEQISRIENKGSKILLAKRSLDPGVVAHCSDCPALSTKGQWLPAEQVTVPTRNCACRSRCKCTISYRYVNLSDRLVS